MESFAAIFSSFMRMVPICCLHILADSARRLNQLNILDAGFQREQFFFKRMIAVALVTEVETFPLLMALSVKQCGIQIQQEHTEPHRR